MRTAIPLLLVLLLALPARADESDLSGTWLIDEEASDSMDAMLLAWGTPGFAVRLMRKLKTSLTIEQSGGEVTLRFKTGIYAYSDSLQPGQPRRSEKRYGEPVDKRERWLEDGTLEAVSWFQLEDGTDASTRSLKKLSDGGQTLVDLVTLTRTGKEPMSARRVYRREVED